MHKGENIALFFCSLMKNKNSLFLTRKKKVESVTSAAHYLGNCLFSIIAFKWLQDSAVKFKFLKSDFYSSSFEPFNCRVLSKT
jgi:hypothetical protein